MEDKEPESPREALMRLRKQAHEEELRQALVPLGLALDEWRLGRISSVEMASRAHRWVSGPGREIHLRNAAHARDETLVAGAVVQGYLPLEAIPPEMQPVIQELIRAFQDGTAPSSEERL